MAFAGINKKRFILTRGIFYEFSPLGQEALALHKGID
jgi:hypothetical protein